MKTTTITALLRITLFSFVLLSPALTLAKQPMEAQIRKDLHLRKGKEFEFLLEHWKRSYGTKAIPSLKKIAADDELEDFDRYVAIMAMARIGGPSASSLIEPYLNAKAWILRTAALRALTFLKASGSSHKIIPLLEDQALVVRNEAVSAVETLRPKGSEKALLNAIKDPRNYHKGKAQWVPKRALEALEKISGKGRYPATASLSTKISYWEKKLK